MWTPSAVTTSECSTGPGGAGADASSIPDLQREGAAKMDAILAGADPRLVAQTETG